MENKIFQAAIDKWGLPAQVAMAHGEMGELATALTQYFVQEKVGPESVIDEIADVQIMMGQMALLIESEDGCEPGSVYKRYQEKLERLAGLVGRVYKKDAIDIWAVGEEFPSLPRKVKVNIGIKQPGMVHKPNEWIDGWFVGNTQCGNYAVVDIDDRQLVTVGKKDLLPGDVVIHTRGFDMASGPDETVEMTITKSVDIDVKLTPKKEQTTLDEREKILLKWPHAQPLRDFIIEHETLEPGSLLVNHYKVDPLEATEQMILNGELLHWYNMQYWFVIEAPRWKNDKDKAKIRELCDHAAESLFAVSFEECREDARGTIYKMIEAGYRMPRKEFPKKTEIELLISGTGLDNTRLGHEVAIRMYDLGYRAPEGGRVKNS